MSAMKDIYGIPELSMTDEVQLTESQRMIIGQKLDMIARCDRIIKYAEQIRSRAAGIPIIDDQSHAQLVEKFAFEVARAEQVVFDSATYGIF